jgi:hypothetical protein
MSNLLTATLTITGTRPAVERLHPGCHPPDQTEKSGVAGNVPDEWRKTVLVTKPADVSEQPTSLVPAGRGQIHQKGAAP